MRKGIANTAAIQVDDVILLAAGENHAVAKSIEALRTNQAGFEQPFQGIAEGLQVRAQVAAAGIADAEFLDESGIVHSTLSEILNAFRIANAVPVDRRRPCARAVGRWERVLLGDR
jgi:hypothetical protein